MGQAKRRSLVPPDFTPSEADVAVANEILFFEERLFEMGLLVGEPFRASDPESARTAVASLSEDGMIALASLFTIATAGLLGDDRLSDRQLRSFDEVGRAIMQAARAVVEERLARPGDGQHRG